MTNHEYKSVDRLNLEEIAPGTITKIWVQLTSDALSLPIKVPVIIAKGLKPGKVLGLTAVVHGDELNGIPVIQRLFQEINVTDLTGMVIGVPVVNVVSFLLNTRRFDDGVDLNHIMPGKANGNASEVYAHRFCSKILKHFDFLLDLHTASKGRVNSYYVRADMKSEMTARMAKLQNAQIIVHNPPSDGTLRGAADEMNIPAITLEVGDPSRFQKGMIRSGLTGLHNLLNFTGMTNDEIEVAEEATIICSHSYWIYTDEGGILRVLPEVAERVKKGDLIATLHNVFGDLKKPYTAEEDGIVIGKSINPVSQAGARILHFGIIKQ